VEKERLNTYHHAATAAAVPHCRTAQAAAVILVLVDVELRPLSLQTRPKRHQALAARIHQENTQAASIVHAWDQGTTHVTNPCDEAPRQRARAHTHTCAHTLVSRDFHSHHRMGGYVRRERVTHTLRAADQWATPPADAAPRPRHLPVPVQQQPARQSSTHPSPPRQRTAHRTFRSDFQCLRRWCRPHPRPRSVGSDPKHCGLQMRRDVAHTQSGRARNKPRQGWILRGAPRQTQ
jgi:hypothetical protein